MHKISLSVVLFLGLLYAQGFNASVSPTEQSFSIHQSAEDLRDSLEAHLEQKIALNVAIRNKNFMLLLDKRLDQIHFTQYMQNIHFNNYQYIEDLLSKQDSSAYRLQALQKHRLDLSTGRTLDCEPFALIFPLSVQDSFDQLKAFQVKPNIYIIDSPQAIAASRSSSVLVYGIDCATVTRP